MFSMAIVLRPAASAVRSAIWAAEQKGRVERLA